MVEVDELATAHTTGTEFINLFSQQDSRFIGSVLLSEGEFHKNANGEVVVFAHAEHTNPVYYTEPFCLAVKQGRSRLRTAGCSASAFTTTREEDVRIVRVCGIRGTAGTARRKLRAFRNADCRERGL